VGATRRRQALGAVAVATGQIQPPRSGAPEDLGFTIGVVVFLAGFTKETTPVANEESDLPELLDALRGE
jgi:hypothetical protein